MNKIMLVVVIFVFSALTAEGCAPSLYSLAEKKLIIHQCMNRSYPVVGLDNPIKPTELDSFNITKAQKEMLHEKTYKCMENATSERGPLEKFGRIASKTPLPFPFALIDEIGDLYADLDKLFGNTNTLYYNSNILG